MCVCVSDARVFHAWIREYGGKIYLNLSFSSKLNSLAILFCCCKVLERCAHCLINLIGKLALSLNYNNVRQCTARPKSFYYMN